MAGAEETEVAPIERRQLGFAETLDDGEDGGVDEPDIGVGIAIAQLADAGVVGRGEISDDVCARLDVGQQGDQCPRAEPLRIQ